MKISLAKHGGQAAAIYMRLAPRMVNTEALSPAEADELARLVDAAKAEPAPQEQRSGRGGDVMSYTITVEDGDGPIVLKRSDTAMSPAFDALRSWLERHTADK